MWLSFRSVLVSTMALTLIVSCADNNEASSVSIVSGNEVDQSTQPKVIKRSTVALSTPILLNEKKITCTASIISEDTLLTAGHCVTKDYDIRLDKYPYMKIIFSSDLDEITETRDVADVIAYDRYDPDAVKVNPETVAADIAFVKFQGGLPAGYAPVKVHRGALPGEFSAIVAGFGSLAKANSNQNRKLNAVEINVENNIDKKTLEGSNGKKGACSGDSGGPLYAEISGEWVQVGITSAGKTNFFGRCNGENSFTNAGEFIDDLLMQIK